jgi:hypothetical protein
MDLRILGVRKVFSDGQHNAFTGIARVHDRTVIAFRSGANHLSLDGAIKVIASADLQSWEVVAEKRHSSLDLRDAKVATFKGRGLVFTGGRVKDGLVSSMVCGSDDGIRWSDFAPVHGLPGQCWLWGLVPFDDVLYGSAYSPEGATLFRSGDGVNWEKLTDFPVFANEVSLDIAADGRLWALAREDRYGCVPAVCTADPPYTRFRSVMRLPLRLQGPLIKRLEGGCAIVCRQWDLPGRCNVRTELLWLEDGREIRRIRTLPSGGDTSYAGWLNLGKGRAVVSYYSAHEHKMDMPHGSEALLAQDDAYAEHSTPADIFLAELSYA